jgi:hypothetical protein
MRNNVIVIVLVILAGVAAWFFRDKLKSLFSRVTGGAIPGGSPVTASVPYDALNQGIQSGNSLAEKNSNPGNLRDFGDKWQGLEGEPKSDGSFCKFSDASSGARAMVKLLLNYVRQGNNTLSKIIARYAPASDSNNPVSYAHAVASALEISPDAVISADDRQMLAAVAYRMHIVEAGYAWVHYQTFLEWANTL